MIWMRSHIPELPVTGYIQLPKVRTTPSALVAKLILILWEPALLCQRCSRKKKTKLENTRELSEKPQELGKQLQWIISLTSLRCHMVLFLPMQSALSTKVPARRELCIIPVKEAIPHIIRKVVMRFGKLELENSVAGMKTAPFHLKPSRKLQQMLTSK